MDSGKHVKQHLRFVFLSFLLPYMGIGACYGADTSCLRKLACQKLSWSISPEPLRKQLSYHYIITLQRKSLAVVSHLVQSSTHPGRGGMQGKSGTSS